MTKATKAQLQALQAKVDLQISTEQAQGSKLKMILIAVGGALVLLVVFFFLKKRRK